MNRKQFNQNIEGLFIELIESNRAKLIISNYYIRVFNFYSDISDYLLTLYDYLDKIVTEVKIEIEYYNDDKICYMKINKNQIKYLRKMGINDITFYFKSYGTILEYNESNFLDFKINESLPREHSVEQLKSLRKLTKGIDIGDRISNMNKEGANIDYIKNPIDTGIESYEEFSKKNKSFIPSWNLKHLISPFNTKKMKRKKK